MKKPIVSPLFLLFASLVLHSLAWWLKIRESWAGANLLLVLSGLLLGWRVAVLAGRISANSRPLPMD